MRDHRQECLGRLQSEYHRNHPWRLGPGGLFVGEFAPESVHRLAKLKKADIASEAERLLNGKGWMPAIFKAADAPEESPQGGAEEVATVADEPAEALAA